MKMMGDWRRTGHLNHEVVIIRDKYGAAKELNQADMKSKHAERLAMLT
jgi:hypothetical protein